MFPINDVRPKIRARKACRIIMDVVFPSRHASVEFDVLQFNLTRKSSLAISNLLPDF